MVICDSTADSLRRNDEQSDGTTLDLDSDVDLEDLEDLLDAIHRNTTIKTIQLEGDAICSLNVDNAGRLMDALGGLPCIKKLFLHNYVAPLPLLTGFLQQAKTIETITLHTAQLAGRTEPEGDDFCTALANLPCLESVKLSNLVFAGGCSLEKLVGRALSRIWGLRSVELEMEQGGSLSLEALGALCQSPNFAELRLWRMTFHPSHVHLIATTVQRNHTLQTLELGEMGYADHAVDSYRAIADMLRANTCLTQFGMINFSGLDDEGCILMAQALEGNATLRELSVRGCDNLVMGRQAAQAVAKMFSRNATLEECCMNEVGIDDDGALAIARALQRDNSTLRSLILQKIVGDVPRAFQGWLEMLDTNVTLERLYPEATGETKEKMDFLLGLNQGHIRNVQLGVDADRHQFLQLLVSNRFDLNRVHYLLSSNPDFCSDAPLARILT